ncbi:MAG: RNA helicase [Thelocarpon superellum]|nr:MAG: RNA helicase [Thelocarpon superellum]
MVWAEVRQRAMAPASICPWCFLTAARPMLPRSRLNMSRSLTQVRRRAPSRMTLSPKVAQPPRPTEPDRKSPTRRSAGPFAAMNMREAGIRGEPSRSPAPSSRATRTSVPERERSRPRGDFKALKMQRSLAPVSYAHRSRVKSRISEVESFNSFPLLPSIHEAITTQALPGLDLVTPTPVQRLAIPILLGAEGKSRRGQTTSGARGEFLLAAETGSGKTLAYLLPTIDAIKRAEAQDADVAAYEQALRDEQERQQPAPDPNGLELPPLSNQAHPTTGRPRAIILVPTSELVSQVGTLAKGLAHAVKFRSGLISSAYTGRVVRNRLFSPGGIDLLVATPHLLASIADSDPNVLSRVTHLIVDEADSLLDRSFSPLTSAIIDRATPSLQQLILCSATIPRSLDSFLRQRFPDIRRLVTPNLHAIPRRVQLGVVDIDKDPYRGNKNLACADTIWTIGRTAAEHAISHGEVEQERMEIKRILVFVNERDRVQEVTDFLISKGIDAVSLSRDTPEQRQSALLASFTSTRSEKAEAGVRSDATNAPTATYTPAPRAPPAVKRSLPNTKVLVTTDLGSRGIDTLAVRHVILYDVPHSTIDFIHRLGRTGRMGRRGRGIVLVGKNDRKDVVREVREGMFKGQALI